MDDVQKILPVTTVKKNLLDIMKNMSDEDSTVTVTKNGLAVGVTRGCWKLLRSFLIKTFLRR